LIALGSCGGFLPRLPRCLLLVLVVLFLREQDIVRRDHHGLQRLHHRRADLDPRPEHLMDAPVGDEVEKVLRLNLAHQQHARAARVDLHVPLDRSSGLNCMFQS
jgi:hypothetical protein